MPTATQSHLRKALCLLFFFFFLPTLLSQVQYHLTSPAAIILFIDTQCPIRVQAAVDTQMLMAILET